MLGASGLYVDVEMLGSIHEICCLPLPPFGGTQRRHGRVFLIIVATVSCSRNDTKVKQLDVLQLKLVQNATICVKNANLNEGNA